MRRVSDAGNEFLKTDPSISNSIDGGPSRAGTLADDAPFARRGLSSETDAAESSPVPLSTVVPAWPRVFPGL